MQVIFKPLFRNESLNQFEQYAFFFLVQLIMSCNCSRAALSIDSNFYNAYLNKSAVYRGLGQYDGIKDMIFIFLCMTQGAGRKTQGQHAETPEPWTLNLNYAKHLIFSFLLSTFTCRSESTPPGLHLVWGAIFPGAVPGLLDGDTSGVRNHPITHSWFSGNPSTARWR